MRARLVLPNQARFKNLSNWIPNSSKIQEFNKTIFHFEARSENLLNELSISSKTLNYEQDSRKTKEQI